MRAAVEWLEIQCLEQLTLQPQRSLQISNQIRDVGRRSRTVRVNDGAENRRRIRDVELPEDGCGLPRPVDSCIICEEAVVELTGRHPEVMTILVLFDADFLKDG